MDQPQNAAEAEWKATVRDELRGRSFRQFQTSKDGNRRKAVILDFSNGFRLWAQYSLDSHAIHEWEVSADSYSIDGKAGDTTFTIYLDNPRSTQEFPDPCDGCIQAEALSISIRYVFSNEKTAFKLNDPERELPLPFPVFRSWTKFEEDEYFDWPLLSMRPMQIDWRS